MFSKENTPPASSRDEVTSRPSTKTSVVSIRQQRQAMAADLGLRDPSTLTEQTIAENLAWDEAAIAAQSVTNSDIKRVDQELAQCAKAFADAKGFEGRSRDALADATAKLYVTARSLVETPAVMVALLQHRHVKIRETTMASAMLPAVKLALPDLDTKTQSLYARVLNHALAHDWTEGQLREAVRLLGIVELAKRETQRQRTNRGESDPHDEASLLERFRQERKSVPAAGLDLPEGTDFVLVIMGRDVNGTSAFVIDDDRKRLLAAIRHADRNHLEIAPQKPQHAVKAA